MCAGGGGVGEARGLQRTDTRVRSGLRLLNLLPPLIIPSLFRVFFSLLLLLRVGLLLSGLSQAVQVILRPFRVRLVFSSRSLRSSSAGTDAARALASCCGVVGGGGAARTTANCRVANSSTPSFTIFCWLVCEMFLSAFIASCFVPSLFSFPSRGKRSYDDTSTIFRRHEEDCYGCRYRAHLHSVCNCQDAILFLVLRMVKHAACSAPAPCRPHASLQSQIRWTSSTMRFGRRATFASSASSRRPELVVRFHWYF